MLYITTSFSLRHYDITFRWYILMTPKSIALGQPSLPSRRPAYSQTHWDLYWKLPPAFHYKMIQKELTYCPPLSFPLNIDYSLLCSIAQPANLLFKWETQSYPNHPYASSSCQCLLPSILGICHFLSRFSATKLYLDHHHFSLGFGSNLTTGLFAWSFKTISSNHHVIQRVNF